MTESEWIAVADEKPPLDGTPVLVVIDGTWGNLVHRVIWTEEIHGVGIGTWAVEDRKHRAVSVARVHEHNALDAAAVSA